jgi:hypothetical protein
MTNPDDERAASGAIIGIGILIIVLLLVVRSCTEPSPIKSTDFFPPTATNIVSVDGTWYTFILDDAVWYVRELKGKPIYLRGPAE